MEGDKCVQCEEKVHWRSHFESKENGVRLKLCSLKCLIDRKKVEDERLGGHESGSVDGPEAGPVEGPVEGPEAGPCGCRKSVLMHHQPATSPRTAPAVCQLALVSGKQA